MTSGSTLHRTYPKSQRTNIRTTTDHQVGHNWSFHLPNRIFGLRPQSQKDFFCTHLLTRTGSSTDSLSGHTLLAPCHHLHETQAEVHSSIPYHRNVVS